MNVSALEEYGLRCAVRLAALKPSKTLSAPEIAESEGLSVEYVSKFMLLLKRAELVRTVRGINGGFALTKAPSEISLKEVFDALGSKRGDSEEFCKSFAGKSESCTRSGSCSIRPFWKILSSYVDEVTREMTLSDLLLGEAATLALTIDLAQKNLEHLKKLQLQVQSGGTQTFSGTQINSKPATHETTGSKVEARPEFASSASSNQNLNQNQNQNLIHQFITEGQSS